MREGNLYTIETDLYDRGGSSMNGKGEEFQIQKMVFLSSSYGKPNHNCRLQEIFTGRYINGFVAGAIVFIDSAKFGEQDGILDDFEYTLTDENGYGLSL